MALDILQKNNLVVYGLLDEDPALHGTEVSFVPVLGSPDDDQYWQLIGDQCEVCVATTQPSRKQLIAKLKAQAMPINAIHPAAILAEAASLGYGNLLGAGVSLGADAHIGHHCIVHARATIEHDAYVGDWTQIGAGSTIGAGVQLSSDVFVGAGATIVGGVTVGKGARIGAGAVVLANVAADATVLGNPAQPVR